jgi:hypothetical protein
MFLLNYFDPQHLKTQLKEMTRAPGQRRKVHSVAKFVFVGKLLRDL